MAAAAAAPRPRRPRKLSPEDNKENVAPQGCGRRRKSPLPVWYPRTPLRDVTTIVQVLEARRARLRAELARAAQQRRLSIETSPEVPPSVSPAPQQDEITATPSDPSVPSDASPSSPPPAATITPLPPQSELQESSPVLRTSASPTNASPAVPQRTPETHPMLCGKINEIEKSLENFQSPTPSSNSTTPAIAGAGDPLPKSFSLPAITFQTLPHLSDYVPSLPSFPTPIDGNPYYHPDDSFYISPTDVILRNILFDASTEGAAATATARAPLVAYHRAGPRKTISFDTAQVTAAIVTCGGLCPGLNTVIRELVVGLWDLYGVRRIFGVPNGYRGFYSAEPMVLEPKVVNDWHKRGGTVLATSRGGFDLEKIVDNIEARGYNQVYIIGGDGTMRGAVKIFNEIRRRKLNISVTGIPKTVDNDIGIIDRSFGFQTAVEMAQQAISAGHVEAVSAVNGIGLVKLMGRNTGHIALHATLSSRDVDCCLIPETDFYLEGKGGMFEFLDQRLKQNGHAVIVVAEGAGQDIIPRTEAQKEERDESGNPVFLDVGAWLKSELKRWWERDHKGELLTVKYIDPMYMVRAVPANATDNLYCTLLAHSAIHGVMAGYTGFVSGSINGNYGYILMEEVAVAKNPVDTKDHKWAWVRSVTNQPDFFRS